MPAPMRLGIFLGSTWRCTSAPRAPARSCPGSCWPASARSKPTTAAPPPPASTAASTPTAAAPAPCSSTPATAHPPPGTATATAPPPTSTTPTTPSPPPPTNSAPTAWPPPTHPPPTPAPPSPAPPPNTTPSSATTTPAGTSTKSSPSPPATPTTPPPPPPATDPFVIALAHNPHLHTTTSHGCQPAPDLASGHLDLRVQSLLAVLAQHFQLRISCLHTGHSVYVNGTRRISNHTVWRAVDIDQVNGQPVNPHSPTAHALVA